MMIPLKQWICDKCGEVIQSPEDGWLEWLQDDEHKAYGFKIVHHRKASPLADPEERGPSCYHYDGQYRRADMHLEEFLGQKGLVYLLSFLDPGPYHAPEFEGPDVVNIREWAELCRRLFIAHYEEARLCWGEALDDGFFEGANPVFMYHPDTLRELLERYSERKGE